MKEIITVKEAAKKIPNGASIMIGGFMGCGNPHGIIKELEMLGTKDLTIISNDASMLNGPNGDNYYGLAKLIHNKQIKKLYASHVGLNPEVAQQMNEGTLEVVLIPQGSLAEMIRAGGMGLGGVLTPTGVGTVVEEAEHVHSIIEVDDKKYLLERPIRADFALISGYKVDNSGNVWYRGTSRNFAPMMAMAADTVIVEAENIVDKIIHEDIVTPGILVDYVVLKEE